MNGPMLIMPLTKNWSDEARVAAIAARMAKHAGLDMYETRLALQEARGRAAWLYQNPHFLANQTHHDIAKTIIDGILKGREKVKRHEEHPKQWKTFSGGTKKELDRFLGPSRYRYHAV